jgi:NDP-sugar pyrophosphorylase family protein
VRSKARLTITLAKDLLKQVDGMVDGKSIRSRSHAIEMLVKDALIPKVTTAVILAGGERQTQTIPALLPIGDRPLIFTMLEHLIRYGINTVYVLANKSGPDLESLVGDGHLMGVKIHHVSEEKPLGTAGAVRDLESRLPPEPFIVIHGDILTSIDLAEFIEFHKQEDTLATIAVKPRDAERKYGKVLMQGNRITDFSQTNQSEGISIVNTGVYLLQPQSLRLIDGGKPVFFETDFFPKLAALNQLSAFVFQGVWFDVSDPESYASAQARWEDN